MKIKMNKKGFTLIELLIVVAIIAILAAIAIPQFSAYRIRAFNGAAQSDLRNAKTTQEAVFAEYGAYGSTQNAVTLIALANPPVLAGDLLRGPVAPATGAAPAGGAIATMISTLVAGTLDNVAGFGQGASNNVSLNVGVNSISTVVGTGFVSYQMRAKHRDGNRGFATNTNPTVCFSENNVPGGYMGIQMTIAAFPTVLVAGPATCNAVASDGNPIATYIGM